MQCALMPLTAEQQDGVMELFNDYVRNGFAAFAEEEYPPETYGAMLRRAEGFPKVWAGSGDGTLLGFALLKPYHPSPAFGSCAELTIFVNRECIGQGIGSRLLGRLERDARQMGLRWLLAAISGPNAVSRRFHRRKGFVLCGRFREVGTKWGRPFDLIWMQKRLV